MFVAVAGLLTVTRAGVELLERQRIQHCADSIALALAVGDPIATTRLTRNLGCRITERSVSNGVVTVVVSTPWGTGTASATSGM